jgi:hypothetical protein
MFNWFKKQKQEIAEKPLEHEDLIEEALWEIKEEFDLKTEEVERTVIDKRQNIEYMRKTLKRDL